MKTIHYEEAYTPIQALFVDLQNVYRSSHDLKRMKKRYVTEPNQYTLHVRKHDTADHSGLNGKPANPFFCQYHHASHILASTLVN